MVAEDIQANIIAKYQNWKYSTGDLVDSFENMVNPERIRSTIMQKMLDTQYKTRHGGDKYTKVNTTNMVPAIVTDNPEDPEDLDSTEVEIEEDTGSTQKPPEAPEDGLRSPSVSNNTDTIFPWGDSQGQKVRLMIQATLTYQISYQMTTQKYTTHSRSYERIRNKTLR